MGKPGWGHAQSLHPEHIGMREGTGGIETSQYPEEWKATATPRVAASETGRAQTVVVVQPAGDAAMGSWDPPEGAADPSGSYQAIEEWKRSGKARHRG